MKKALEEAIIYQQNKMQRKAQCIVPRVTVDDLWQPNDFMELETEPEFRYEEGVLHGLLMARTLLQEFDR